MKYNIGLAQIEPVTAEKYQNISIMEGFLKDTAKDNIDLIIYPELALTGYNCGDKFFKVAEAVPGPSTEQFVLLAKKYNSYIIWGMPELGLDGVLYNVAVLVGPEGYIGKWRKHTLPGHASNSGGPGAFPDRRFFRAGSNSPVFKTEIGTIGLMVCYDVFFPEISRLLVLKGADILVGISGSPSFEKNIFEPLIKARAMENTVWFAYSNLAGQEGETTYWGGSRLVGPGNKETKVPGEPIVCKAPYDEPAVVVGTVDYNLTKEFRPFFPVLRDIRVDFYNELYECAKKIT